MNLPVSTRSPSTPSAASPLDIVRGEVDALLANLSENKLEARRAITRDLGLDPSPEELQTIVKIAHEPPGSDYLEKLSRTALSVRVLADRTLRDLLDGALDDAPKLERAASLAPTLLQASDALAQAIDSRIETLGSEARDYLLRIGDSLIPAEDALISGTVIGTRLVLLAREGAQGDPCAVIPSLSADEAALIRSGLRAGESAGEASRRIRINALILRTIIVDDLENWNTAQDGSADGGEVRERLLRRLERDASAYHFLSGRLQDQQDTALVANLRGLADELRGAKQSLFSTYLKLSPILNKGAVRRKSGADPATDEDGKPENVQQLFEASVDADSAVESRRGERVTEDELYLDALKDMKRPTVEPELADELVFKDLRRERLRLRILGGIAALCLVGCVLVYGFMLGGAKASNEISAADLPPRLVPTEAVAVGPMLYARVNSWIWDDLDYEQRIAEVREMGIRARERGFESVYLTDENSRDLALWDETDGAELLDEPPVSMQH